MATTAIEVRCNARPTRLGFILPRPDSDLLLTVFKQATSLWGGIFNPIIILDDSTRKTAGVHYTQVPPDPYLELQRDTLKAFDPDVLISYSQEPLPNELKAWQHRTFPADHRELRPTRSGMSYFVDILPVLQDLWDKEFKGVTEPRFKLKFIAKAEAEKSLFQAARFGLYPSDEYYVFLQENFKAEPFAYDANFRSSHWPGDFQTLLGLTASYCRPTRQRVHSHAFFLLNPDDPFDLIDYWNLRASGMYLLPLTLENYQECTNSIRDFGTASSYPINETVKNVPTIIKAASIKDEEVAAMTQWITEHGLVKSPTIMGWVPCYQTEGYGVVNELDVSQLRGFEANAVGVLIDGHGTIQGPVPSFLGGGSAFAHWSMDLSLFAFRAPNICYRLPWLNFGCDALVRQSFNPSLELGATRVSEEGVVTRHWGNSGDLRIGPITAAQVVQSFLLGRGIEYLQISSPGLALSRIIEMMDGFYNCEIFRNSAIRETLEDLSTGKHRLASEVAGKISKSLQQYKVYGQQATKEQISERTQAILNRAIAAGVFRVGIEFQCSRCRRHHWYAIAEFDKQYNCKSCFSREETPRLDRTKWFYASDGLFRSANKLDGNLTVLLALAFFDQMFDSNVKYAASFDYRLEGEPHEMDFGIIASRMIRPTVEMIFGESKSGTELKQDERKKLKVFGKQTGAYLCFCTLADDFSEDDKEFFKDLFESEIKIILLPRTLLEMDLFEFLKFRTANNPGRSRSEADWLMRLTILRTLGETFANKHYIWL
jgi:hypothetical protein